MGYSIAPKYKKKDVNRAGRLLAASHFSFNFEELDWMYGVVNNWRASHWLPLVIFRVKLENKAYKIDSNCIVSQRIKRMSSIKFKLIRFNTMTLYKMQDLGGCRAIMENVKDVYTLYDAYKNSKSQSKLIREKDYIKSPKPSGYRGIHLIYEYKSNKNTKHNGLYIEIQLRSKLQHIWATTVETVDVILKQSLKASRGDADWQRFFALMGSVLALKEGCSEMVPGAPKDETELLNELRSLVKKLEVEQKLEMYSNTLQELSKRQLKTAYYYLLELRNPGSPDRSTKITSFTREMFQKATDEYLKAEKTLAGTADEVVLVRVDKISELEHAYPNYFLDTKAFINELRNILNS